jgi:hypothetical protein
LTKDLPKLGQGPTKVFEVNVLWAIGYEFFGLMKLIHEKGTERVLFKCFSKSLNMKNP